MRYVSPLAVPLSCIPADAPAVRANYRRKSSESPSFVDVYLPNLSKPKRKQALSGGSLGQSHADLQASRRLGSTLRESASEPLLGLPGAKTRQRHQDGDGGAQGRRLSPIAPARPGEQLPDIPSPTAVEWLSRPRPPTTDIALPDLKRTNPKYHFAGTPEEGQVKRRGPKPEAVAIPQMSFFEAAALGKQKMLERLERERRQKEEELKAKSRTPSEISTAATTLTTSLPQEVELPPTEESCALTEISHVASTTLRGLDKIMLRYERNLHSMRSGDEITQRATYEVTYGDPVFARALKVAAQARVATEEALRKPPKIEEAPALKAISLLSQQVSQEMGRLQQEGWARGALEALREGERAAQESAAEAQDAKDSEELAATQRLPPVEEEEEPADDEQLVAEPGRQSLSPTRVSRKMSTVSRKMSDSEGEGSPRAGDVLPEDDPNLDVPRLQRAFFRFKVGDSFDIDVGDLNEVMHYLGHIRMTKEETSAIAKEVASYDMLEYDEFLKFAQKFVQQERDKFQEMFCKVGAGADEISVKQMRKLFVRLGKLPFRYVVQEALESVGKRPEDSVNFEEVMKCFGAFKKTEGFALRQVGLLKDAFEDFCKKDTEMVAASDFTDSMVHFFGVHAIDFASVMQVQLESGHILRMPDMDSSSSGGLKPVSLPFEEFLIFARKLREALFDHYQKEYPDWAWNGAWDPPEGRPKMVIDMAMLQRTLTKMGYTPLAQNIKEVLDGVLFARPEPFELDFVQFFEFCSIMRQREGFISSAVKDFKTVFDKFDDDGSGEVGALELADIFRYLGHDANLDDLTVFLLEVDSNGSNMLDFREFLRLMRLHREKELSGIKKCFEKNLKQGHTTLSIGRLYDGLEELHHTPAARLRAMEAKLEKDGADFDMFVYCVDACRGEKVAKQRKYAGFSEDRLQEFDIAFKRLDKDNSGEINTLELTQMLMLQDWAPKTQEEQKALMGKLDKARANAREAGIQDVGTDGSGDIKFWTYVQLARIMDTDQQQKVEEEMKVLMKELQFSKGEVDEFRAVFVERKRECERELRAQGVTGKIDGISVFSVRSLIRIFVTRISPEDKASLDKQVEKALDGGMIIDFPSFLKLMRWLLDSGLTQKGGKTSSA